MEKIYGVLLTFSPAAADTIKKFLLATNTKPSDYDKIFTGDLGRVGSEMLYELLGNDGINIGGGLHNDCGLLLYDQTKQDVHSGGSGCGCSASVLCTHILNELNRGGYKKVLFCATGALLSATTAGQGENIPGIAHLIEIEDNQN